LNLETRILLSSSLLEICWNLFDDAPLKKKQRFCFDFLFTRFCFDFLFTRFCFDFLFTPFGFDFFFTWL